MDPLSNISQPQRYSYPGQGQTPDNVSSTDSQPGPVQPRNASLRQTSAQGVVDQTTQHVPDTYPVSYFRPWDQGNVQVPMHAQIGYNQQPFYTGNSLQTAGHARYTDTGYGLPGQSHPSVYQETAGPSQQDQLQSFQIHQSMDHGGLNLTPVQHAVLESQPSDSRVLFQQNFSQSAFLPHAEFLTGHGQSQPPPIRGQNPNVQPAIDTMGWSLSQGHPHHSQIGFDQHLTVMHNQQNQGPSAKFAKRDTVMHDRIQPSESGLDSSRWLSQESSPSPFDISPKERLKNALKDDRTQMKAVEKIKAFLKTRPQLMSSVIDQRKRAQNKQLNQRKQAPTQFISRSGTPATSSSIQQSNMGSGALQQMAMKSPANQSVMNMQPRQNVSPKELLGVTKDSGIGSSLGSTSAKQQQATRRSEKARSRTEMTTVCGSLPDDSSGEQLSLFRQKENPEFDPEALKRQKQGMKSFGLSSKELKLNKINRWLQGNEIVLGEGEESPEGISTAVCKLLTSDDILGDEIDLGEDGEVHEGISTAMRKLVMSGLNPLPETLKVFSNCLQDINLQVHELDLSNNVILGEDKVNHIGAVARYSNVSSLLLQGCKLNLKTMQKLQESIEGKLTKLDVSKANESKNSPAKLGPDGLAVLGNIVSEKGIRTLALRNHDLQQDHMSRLRQSLAGAKLLEIDVSGNDSLGLDGIAELAKLVQETRVENLILRNCGLNAATLLKLKDSIGDSKLTTLDVSENTQLGTDAMACLGGIAKQCMISNLLLRNLLLTQDHITALKQSLDGFLLMELDIGKKRPPAHAIFESDSTASDDTGYTEENSQSKVLSSEEQGISDLTSTISNKDTPLSFQPEHLIINLLPSVKKRINIDNWEIANEGKKVIEDEMRKRKLSDLEISHGSGKIQDVISLSTYGHTEHADLLSHHKVKDFSEVAPPAKVQKLKLECKSIERPDIRISTLPQKDGPNSKNATGDGEAINLVMGRSPQETAQRKYIGKEGGEINICGCKIEIPRDALEREKEIQVSICPDEKGDFDADTIAVTPTFRFKPSVEFEKPVTVEMETSLRAVGDNKIPVKVLTKKQGKPWTVLAQTIVDNKGVIRFETLHFSKFKGKVSADNASQGEWLLTNGLYINKETTFIASVFVKKLSVIEDELQKSGFARLPVMPEDLIVKLEDRVEFRVECINPKKTKVKPKEFSFAVTKNFLKKKSNQRYFVMDPNIDETPGIIKICYYLKPVDEDEMMLPLRFCWPLAEAASTGQQEDNDGVRVKVKVKKENITANYLAKSHGKIDTNAENCTTTANQRWENPDSIPSTSRKRRHPQKH